MSTDSFVAKYVGSKISTDSLMGKHICFSIVRISLTHLGCTWFINSSRVYYLCSFRFGFSNISSRREAELFFQTKVSAGRRYFFSPGKLFSWMGSLAVGRAERLIFLHFLAFIKQVVYTTISSGTPNYATARPV